MISWMQKHNKYLVWTIWIATIAFIGAGFVGWGSYNLGSNAGSIAKVGDIEIKQSKLNQAYNNLYGRYNQMMKGKLDDEKAKELGLVQQAFSNIAVQAKILNYAKDNGIIVSDKELLTKLSEIKSLQKDGQFNREIYDRYLQSQRLKAKDFETALKDDLIIQKTLALLKAPALPPEVDTVSASLNIADKFSYSVLSNADIDYKSDEIKVKSFWENQKENYMTKKAYTLSLVWTSSDETTVTDEEIKAHYDANSFNYTDAQGKQLDFNSSKAQAAEELKIKKTKKAAQKSYIAFKKGELKSSEEITLSEYDKKLTPSVWNELQSTVIGDIMKPKVIGTQYVTVKINAIEEPKIMTFEEAKEIVTKEYDRQAKKEALLTLADTTLKNIDKSNAEVADYITREDSDKLKSLNSQESLQFLQKLFTSNKEKGIISVLDKVVVYSILDQKILLADDNKTENIRETVNNIKNNIFESNFIKMLDSKYPTETYMKGLAN